MRFLYKLIGALLALSILGYFGFLNNHSFPVYIWGDYSLHLPAWFIIYGLFLLGLLLSWCYHVLLHPARWLQRAKHAYMNYRDTKHEDWNHEFREACLRRDVRAIRQVFGKLKRFGTPPLYLQVQQLQQLRYQYSGTKMLEEFSQLKQQFPNHLQVLLPYLQLALEVKDWGRAELLSHEILQLAPEHPEALDGLSLVYAHRQDWDQCIAQEKKLLTRYAQSMVAEQLLSQHEAHLLQRVEVKPQTFQKAELKYLPNASSFREFHEVPLTISHAKTLSEAGQYLKAAQQLKRCYEKTASPAVLDALETVFDQTGKSEKVWQTLQELQNSSSVTLYVQLVNARILYRWGKIEEAWSLLDSIQASQTQLPPLYHALRFLIAQQKDNTSQQLEAAQSLIAAEDVLNNPLRFPK